MTDLYDFLLRGGPVLVLIAALSVTTLAVILWKLWDLWRLGAWRRGRAEAAVRLWTSGDRAGARAALSGRQDVRARVLSGAMSALADPHRDALAREETTRLARAALVRARSGLRLVELVVTLAPLLGLLGTVIGMIAAFQALEATGARADPVALAGGIWEALLTTAAGMGVAIPASVALSWFDGAADRLQSDLEDLATRLFTGGDGA